MLTNYRNVLQHRLEIIYECLKDYGKDIFQVNLHQTVRSNEEIFMKKVQTCVT